MLFFCFSLPMVAGGIYAISQLSILYLPIALFVIPIGIMPIHLLVISWTGVCITERQITFKKYAGFWYRSYDYQDLVAYRVYSYPRWKGSRKRYRTLLVQMSDDRIFECNESNIANFQPLYQSIVQINPDSVEHKALGDDTALWVWLTYISIAILGIATIFWVR
jgi:hypothetical protein